MKKILTAGLLLTCFWANNLVAMTLTEATTGAHRSGENIARNAHRNPTKTLEFFGLKENMTVLEIWPGSRGWYTEVLAPYLKTKGVYYAANFDGSTGAAYFEKAAKKFVITQGKNGAMVFDGETFIDIEPYPIKAVDSTGAGDMFSGAFLYGITHGHTYASSAKLASKASSEIVSKYGPRLAYYELQEVKEEVIGNN